MPCLRSLLLAHIITYQTSVAGVLARLRHLVKQLLLSHHAILIVEAKAMQTIRSHALLTSACLT